MITPAHVERLEAALDGFNESLPPLKEFILPGGGAAAAGCHVARTVCRRAERRCWSLARVEAVAPDALKYLNRLSDLLVRAGASAGASRVHGSEVLWRGEEPAIKLVRVQPIGMPALQIGDRQRAAEQEPLYLVRIAIAASSGKMPMLALQLTFDALRASGGDQAARVRPIERRPGIGLSPRSDIAVADQASGCQRGVGRAQRRYDIGKCLILHGLIGKRIGAFEFHADRKIIAGLTAVVAGLSRVPRALREAHVLGDGAVAPYDKVRGDALRSHLGEIRMCFGRQCVGEQPVNPRTPEFTGRQAYAMDDDQIGFDTRGPRVAIRGSNLPHTTHQSALKVDLHLRILMSVHAWGAVSSSPREPRWLGE